MAEDQIAAFMASFWFFPITYKEMLKRTYSCMTSSSETLNANCACARAAVHSADKKTTRYFEALGEAVDVDYEAYCWRRSGFFWRTRASLGLACARE